MTQDAPTLDDVRTDVLGFLSTFVDELQVTDDEPLISGGLFDSLVAVQLIDHLQTTYGFEVGDSDLDLPNFDTVTGIHAFVRRKLAPA